jgi:hypothetical protein
MGDMDLEKGRKRARDMEHLWLALHLSAGGLNLLSLDFSPAILHAPTLTSSADCPAARAASIVLPGVKRASPLSGVKLNLCPN